MSFLAKLAPVLQEARRNGCRTFLLAHSMGNLALQSAVENWFLHGNGPDGLFDLALLAAADCGADAFDQPKPARLSGLIDLAGRVAIYYSRTDLVLGISSQVNGGAQRLGWDGPNHRTDPAAFPPAQYAMTDCTAYHDYPGGVLSSHQYYRLSPGVRTLIAREMGAVVGV